MTAADALEALERARRIIDETRDTGTFTIYDMREARKYLLSVVQDFLDNRVSGHMPDRRHY